MSCPSYLPSLPAASPSVRMVLVPRDLTYRYPLVLGVGIKMLFGGYLHGLVS